MNNTDIIVIGGGLNGLITANLLAKSGKTVLLFESREKIGGMYSTLEFYSGETLLEDYNNYEINDSCFFLENIPIGLDSSLTID